MKTPGIIILFAASVWAQTFPDPFYGYQPLGRLQQFLALTDDQLQTILSNNGDYNQFAMTRQARISQLQAEIAAETAKDTLDPMALGVRYAEIESICREMKDQAGADQKQNTGILTDAQKQKLQVLQDAMKLAPVISEAQSGNLIGTATYAPPFFTSTSGTIASGSFGAIGAASGCYSPFPVAIRIGDFSAAPANATPISGAPLNPATEAPSSVGGGVFRVGGGVNGPVPLYKVEPGSAVSRPTASTWPNSAPR